MTGLDLFKGINYTLILLYGYLLSVNFSGGFQSRSQAIKIACVFLFTEILQAASAYFFGVELTTKIYPLIVHVPIILSIYLIQKKSFSISVIVMMTSYFCCQVPRLISFIVDVSFSNEIATTISYFLAIIISYIGLRLFICQKAYASMTYSKNSLLLFGAMPIAYYIYDYTTAVYTNLYYENARALNEVVPIIIGIIYIFINSLFYTETIKKSEAELKNSLMEIELKQSLNELSSLKQAQEQAAIYRHDMRHHFNIIQGYIDSNEIDKATKYIKSAQDGIDKITVKKYCENNAVNLIISSFASKAEQNNISFNATLSLPNNISISETELCALISNGIENAVKAAAGAEKKYVNAKISLVKDNLLIEIENSYTGTIDLENGIPVTKEKGHGFGTKSMIEIVKRNSGIYSFTANDGIFKLRIVLKSTQT